MHAALSRRAEQAMDKRHMRNVLDVLPGAAPTVDSIDESMTSSVFRRVVRRFVSDDSGQDLIEYALLAALVGIAAILTWQQVATTVGVAFGEATGTGANGVQAISCPPGPDGVACS
jgi:pilus assembly protein Flp/PilA